MSSEQEGGGSSSPKVTRRDILKAGAAGAVGLGAAAALGTPALAAAAPGAPTLLRHNSPQTLKLLSWVQFEPGRKDAWKAVLDKFNASQKDYNVVFSGWESNIFTTQVLIQAQAGSIDADVMTMIPDLGLRVMQLGLLAPIDDIIAKLGVHPSKAHDFMRMKGHLYGISIVEVPFAVVYNSQSLAKAGIHQPATTIDGWQSQLKELTRKPKQYGIWQPNASAEIFNWWFQLQEFCLAYDTVWAKGKTPLLNTDPIIKGLELWQSQYKNYMAAGATQGQALRLFSNGQIAEELNVSAAVNQYKVTSPAVYQYVRSVPPPWPTKKSISRLHPLGIVAGTSKMDGAKAFVEFMATPANMALLMEKGLDVVPPYPEVNKVPGFKQYMDSQFWAKGYLDITAVPFPDVMGDFISHNTEFGNIVTTNFQRALISNTTVAQAMATAQQQVVALGQRVFR